MLLLTDDGSVIVPNPAAETGLLWSVGVFVFIEADVLALRPPGRTTHSEVFELSSSSR
jgi:hypothetical protein